MSGMHDAEKQLQNALKALESAADNLFNSSTGSLSDKSDLSPIFDEIRAVEERLSEAMDILSETKNLKNLDGPEA